VIARHFELLIKEKVAARDFQYSAHGLERAELEKIYPPQIIEAVLSGEIIEDYPEDQRGHSCLFFGYADERPLHVGGGIRGGIVNIITTYEPNMRKRVWMPDLKTRIRKE